MIWQQIFGSNVLDEVNYNIITSTLKLVYKVNRKILNDN